MLASERSQQLSEVDDVNSNYGSGVNVKGKSVSTGFFSKNRGDQDSQKKLYHINTEMQKKFFELRKTSKSRFEGVNKYINKVYRDKQLPVPSFSKNHQADDLLLVDQSKQNTNSLLQGEELIRNDSSDLLMERVGQPDKVRSVTNLRQANI